MNKIAFMFPGQGSQYVGMGQELYQNYQIAKDVFEEADDVLGFSLSKMCFEGDMDELTRTVNTQPALLTTSVAVFKVLMSQYDLKPEFLLGHSLGEISALTCAGAIDFKDAVQLVRLRGTFMQEASKEGEGAMLAVRNIPIDVIEDICKQVTKENQLAVISNYNSSRQIVLSGHTGAIDSAAEVIRNQGGKAMQLKVSAPFHSPLMKKAADKFHEELLKRQYHPLNFPVVSNVDAKIYEGADEIVTKLTRQLTQPVLWTSMIEKMEESGITHMIEIGPKKVLCNLVRDCSSTIKRMECETLDNISALEETLQISKHKFQDEASKVLFLVKHCMQNAVATKNNNDSEDEYQVGVVAPYQELNSLNDQLEKNEIQPTKELARKALSLLATIFETKQIEKEEANDRIMDLLKEASMMDEFQDFLK